MEKLAKKIKKTVSKKKEDIKDDQAKGAQKAFMEELFNDYYLERGKVYKMNFFRGIFFALGSILGGTVVLALLIWLLSLFGEIPFIGEYFQDTQNVIEQGQNQQQ